MVLILRNQNPAPLPGRPQGGSTMMLRLNGIRLRRKPGGRFAATAAVAEDLAQPAPTTARRLNLMPLMLRLLGPALAIALLLAGGCEMFNGDNESGKAGTSVAIYPDIPVMAGMTYVPKESFIYNTGEMRIVTLKYVGKAKLMAAVQFYTEQMRALKWGSPNDSGTDPVVMGNDPITLYFRKGDELATVNIDSRQKGQTVLTIWIRGEKTVSPTGPGDKKSR